LHRKQCGPAREREWIFIRTVRYYKECGTGSSKKKELEQLQRVQGRGGLELGLEERKGTGEQRRGCSGGIHGGSLELEEQGGCLTVSSLADRKKVEGFGGASSRLGKALKPAQKSLGLGAVSEREPLQEGS